MYGVPITLVTFSYAECTRIRYGLQMLSCIVDPYLQGSLENQKEVMVKIWNLAGILRSHRYAGSNGHWPLRISL